MNKKLPSKDEKRVEAWERELRDVYERAASTDDKSDFDCLLPAIRSLLTQSRKEWLEELIGEVEKMREFTQSPRYECPLDRTMGEEIGKESDFLVLGEGDLFFDGDPFFFAEFMEVFEA